MANEPNRPDDVRTNEMDSTDTSASMDRARDNADVVSASPSTPETGDEQADITADREVPLEASSDPADAIPVPPAMSPAEIDERAQAVEAVRGKVDPETDVAT